MNGKDLRLIIIKRLKSIVRTNAFICSALTITLLLCIIFRLPPLQSMEKSFYDFLNGLRHTKQQSPVVLVEIDEKSIRGIGSWPWPRSYVADMVHQIDELGPRVIGLDLFYRDKEINPGLDEIQKIRKSLRNDRGRLTNKNLVGIDKDLLDVERRIDNDERLIAAVRSARNVVLPAVYATDNSGRNGLNLPSWLRKQTISAPTENPSFFTLIKGFQNPAHAWDMEILKVSDLDLPFPDLSRKSKLIGFNNLLPDSDGVFRRHNLFVQCRTQLVPSFALQASLLFDRSMPEDIQISRGDQGFSGIKYGTKEIATDSQFRMLVDFNVEERVFSRYSFIDVVNGAIPAKAFKNKLVIIGLTAPSWVKYLPTSPSAVMSPIAVEAQCAANIINNGEIHRPGWAWLLEGFILLYIMAFLLFIVPRVNRKVGGLLIIIFLATWTCGVTILFITQGLWFNAFAPTILAGLGFGAIQLNNKITGSAGIDENTETNKMLGLSFQSQGMLDMAFDKFMKCSQKDPSVKDLLYNLGLDFERKRMHNKAVAVYEHILQAGKFKDIKERVSKLKKVEESVIVGSSQNRADTTLLLDNVETRPTLGRYEIIKEIGQGAIGTVYLGRDPKINREVAVKVLRYDEVSSEQLNEVKQRFYREAEAAGRLSHPNIVTIYDAGEDYDLTYMAMELLNGQDLSPFCREDNLLPVNRVLEIISSVAQALDYAHKNGVVHRDIKPANIMMLDNGLIKVADFGIARIVDSSRTHTGDIMGTPNYMSPEQVAGKKVDGRSDLFSLGAVFYEMLCGRKPFQSDTMASIMFNIANANYTPLQGLAPHIPDCCITIVDKLLTKGVTRRFQSAALLVAQVSECMAQLDES